MQDFEKLGVFYLGRPYDLGKKQSKPGWLLYDSKDLVTHAVCVGMTGSGKTGLCLGLLEEAAIDGIPAIAIDPKGDISNLLLTFPELRAQDFRPWINEDDAAKKGITPDAYAEQQAGLWRKGLASWEQDGERIARLKAAADFAIYTPGSQAGLPVSILRSFDAPPDAVRGDAELLRERIGTTVTSVLHLLGLDADPVQSRDHILISRLLEAAWSRGANLDLGALVQQIHMPPFTKVGVLDLEAFYPSKDRMRLATTVNNLLAAPGFDAWMSGEPLDIDRVLHGASGKPRIAIFSIAHLNDAERMFFVSLLLNQVIGWMRAQSGTTSLRAVLYMDEIFGYFPPVANPPSKAPLLTLLKQARAYGLGVVLATQNPVDLDYKGLSNTGTWFIGRLQTERDKARVLEGLEGAAAGSGQRFDRGRMEELLAGLGNRIFLMNNVHEDEPVVFETRWTLSYLCGPLTRTQIATLTQAQKSAQPTPPTEKAAPPSGTRSSMSRQTSRPVLPPTVPQYFLPVRTATQADATLRYDPAIIGIAELRISQPKLALDLTTTITAIAPLSAGPRAIDWDQATIMTIAMNELEREGTPEATYGDLPSAAAQPKSYTAWTKDFASWLSRTQSTTLYRSETFGAISRPGESERDFRIRLQQLAREARDRETTKLRERYATKIASLQERRRRAAQAQEREAEEASHQHLQTAISAGATLLTALLGRKTLSTSTLGRATTAARSVGRSLKKREDASRAEENVEVLDRQIAELEDQIKREVDELASRFDPQTEALETVTVKPARGGVSVKLLSLAWVPASP